MSHLLSLVPAEQGIINKAVNEVSDVGGETGRIDFIDD